MSELSRQAEPRWLRQLSTLRLTPRTGAPVRAGRPRCPTSCCQRRPPGGDAAPPHGSSSGLPVPHSQPSLHTRRRPSSCSDTRTRAPLRPAALWAPRATAGVEAPDSVLEAGVGDSALSCCAAPGPRFSAVGGTHRGVSEGGGRALSRLCGVREMLFGRCWPAPYITGDKQMGLQSAQTSAQAVNPSGSPASPSQPRSVCQLAVPQRSSSSEGTSPASFEGAC